MFKKLETKWNAHTPVYLHNGTKENLMFQLGAAAGIVLVLVVKDEWERRRWQKRYNEDH